MYTASQHCIRPFLSIVLVMAAMISGACSTPIKPFPIFSYAATCNGSSNVNITSADISSKLVTSAADCCSLCNATLHCAAAVYTAPVCHLKAFTWPTAPTTDGSVALFLPPPSDLARMLQFVGAFQSNCSDASWTKATPVCSWSGVTCDIFSRVVKFDWSAKMCTGVLSQWNLPTALQSLDLHVNNFTGTLNFAEMPSTLQELNLHYNSFMGTLNLRALPNALQTANLVGNQFVGTVDLTKMPTGLRTLALGTNRLSGTVDLSQLPLPMTNLDLSMNTFQGKINLGFLPKGLQSLDVGNNAFSGSIDLSKLPLGGGFLTMNLGMNGFSGTINWSSLPKGDTLLSMRLDLSFNNLTGTIDLTNVPSYFPTVILAANQFEGTVDLTTLPAGFQYLDLGANLLTGTLNLSKLPNGLTQLHLYSNMFSGSLDFAKVPAAMDYFDLRENPLICGTGPLDTVAGCGEFHISLPSQCLVSPTSASSGSLPECSYQCGFCPNSTTIW